MKRKIFYPLVLIVSFLIGVLPPFLFEPRGGWGLGGLIFIPFWGFLILVDVLIFVYYEFRHLSGEVNFKRHQRTSLVMLVIVSLYSIIKLFVTGKLFIVANGLELSQTEQLLSFYPFIMAGLALIYILFLLATFGVYFFLSMKEHPIVPKLAIFVFVVFIIFVIPSLFSLGGQIGSLNRVSKTLVFQKVIENSDMERCLTVNSEGVCKREIALKNNNWSICKEMQDHDDSRYSPLYKCFITIARDTRNESICNILKNSSEFTDDADYDRCKMIVLGQIMNDLVGESTDAEIIDRATHENNIDICLSIEHTQHARDCELAVAKLNNESFCEKIHWDGGTKHIKECYEFFS